MAFTVAQLWRTPDSVEYSVIASANGDTDSPNMVHGCGAAPVVKLIPWGANGDSFYASTWRVSTNDATNVVVTKSGAAGGAAGIQLRVRVERRH